MVMVNGRLVTLVTVLAVLLSPALSSFLKNGGKGFGYSKSYSSLSPSHHTPTVPVKATYPVKPALPAVVPAHPYTPPQPGYGSSPPVGYPPVGYPVFVWPSGSSPYGGLSAQNAEEEDKEELNCEKRVPRYIGRRFFSELGPQFWVNLNQRLEEEQCHANSAGGCKRFAKDGPFQAVASYVWNFCENDFSNPEYLAELVLDYCQYHSEDEAVKEAFECTTGCRLADHLDQVCHVIKLSQDCPTGFELELGRCYKFVDAGSAIEFQEAVIACAEDDAELVRIDSAAENAAVLALILGKAIHADYVWIGLNNFVDGSDFHWLGDSAAVEDPDLFTNWKMSEPDIHGQACVKLDIRPTGTGEWSDTECAGNVANAEVNTFLCERPPILMLDHEVVNGN